MPLGDELLNTVAGLLGKLRWKVVYLGGSTTHLHLSDPTAPAPELTDDVDVVLDVTSPVEFQVSVREELKAPHLLPGGTSIYLIRAPVFLATKLEAYRDRGKDCLSSKDVEDIIALLDGRPELGDELAAMPEDLQEFVVEALQSLMDEPNFDYAVQGYLHEHPTRSSDVFERVQAILTACHNGSNSSYK